MNDGFSTLEFLDYARQVVAAYYRVCYSHVNDLTLPERRCIRLTLLPARELICKSCYPN